MPHQAIQFNDHITAAPPLSHTKHTPGLFEEGRLWKSAQVFAAHQAGRSEAMDPFCPRTSLGSQGVMDRDS